MPMLRGEEGKVGCRHCGLKLGVKELGENSWDWDFDENPEADSAGDSFCKQHCTEEIFKFYRKPENDWAHLTVTQVSADCCHKPFQSYEAFAAHLPCTDTHTEHA